MQIPWQLLIAYTIYNFFAFYQKLHVKNFRGSSQGFLLVLNIFALATTLFGIGFLIYWGWNVSWLQAIAVFVVALVIQSIWFFFEAKLGLRESYFVVSLIGFLVIPVSGVFMWFALP